mgnify:CR=1 FL=1
MMDKLANDHKFLISILDASIYAGWKGYLDAIDVSKVAKFEHDLYSTLDEEKTILSSISKEKQMNEDTEKKLIEVIKKVVELNK